MFSLLLLLTYALHVTSLIVSDSACPCLSGCLLQSDWNGQLTKWCVLNQTVPCGISQPGYGYVDTCAFAAITPNLLVTPVYTGQILNVSWSTTNILEPEVIRVGYSGRLLGSATVSQGYVANFLPDTTTPVTNAVITLNTTTSNVSAAIPGFTILQSKVQTVSVYNQGTLISTGGGGGGNTVPCDGRNLTVSWLGIGNAQVGNATVTIKSNFGGTTVVGTSVILPSVSLGTTSVNYTCPRSFVSPGFGSFSATVTVYNPYNPAPYTATSSSFSISNAPSQTPTSSSTPSQTPTISITPTPSLSFGATASGTPSKTPTVSFTSSITPSQTPTVSFTSSSTPSGTATPSSTPTASQTPSMTPTPRSILQLVTGVATQSDTPVIVGSITGSIFALALVFGITRIFQRRQQTAIRRARLQVAARRQNADRQFLYGMPPSIVQPLPHRYPPVRRVPPSSSQV